LVKVSISVTITVSPPQGITDIITIFVPIFWSVDVGRQSRSEF